MKYCPECGNEVQEGARFCPNCRHELTRPGNQQGRLSTSRAEDYPRPVARGGGMGWGEAFSRTFGAILALIGIYILVAILAGVAGVLIYDANEIWGIVVGAIALLIFIIAIYAVALKSLTDAVADHVEGRLSRQLASRRSQSSDPPR